MVNGKPVSEGDTIRVTDELTLSPGSYIMYTTDGSYPVSWSGNSLGEATPDATLYSKENIAPLLAPGAATLRAISKNGSNWSATISRRVFVVDEQTDGINEDLRMKSEEGSDRRTEGKSQFADAVYDLSGRKINTQCSYNPSSFGGAGGGLQLKKGVYIINGRKEIR